MLKPLIFINCGIHAREWISPASCMYITNKVFTLHLLKLGKRDFTLHGASFHPYMDGKGKMGEEGGGS